MIHLLLCRFTIPQSPSHFHGSQVCLEHVKFIKNITAYYNKNNFRMLQCTLRILFLVECISIEENENGQR